jgi:hypothetical protein
MADLVSLALCVGIVILVFYWLRRPLAHTLNGLVEMTEATEFYIRCFALVLIFSGLAAGLEGLTMPENPPPPPPAAAKTSAATPIAPPPPPQPAMVRYVNAATKDLQKVANNVSYDVLWFLGFITVLAAFLRKQTAAAATPGESASLAAGK